VGRAGAVIRTRAGAGHAQIPRPGGLTGVKGPHILVKGLTCRCKQRVSWRKG